MAANFHSNIFAYTGDMHEAYVVFLGHQRRDTRLFQAFGAAGIVLFPVAMILLKQDNDLWPFVLVASLICLLQSMIHFCDLSNRNFLLHTIDYMEFRHAFPRRTGREETNV
jgi:hypothetical protein